MSDTPQEKTAGRMRQRELAPNGTLLGDFEHAALLITVDEEGDYIVRDLNRNGCLCHGETMEEAGRRYDEARRMWDEAANDQPSTPGETERGR